MSTNTESDQRHSSAHPASQSVSPPRRAFGAAISAMGARLRGVSVGRDREAASGRGDVDGYNAETESLASTVVEGVTNASVTDRSLSRGRYSSGRGGAGNIYPTVPVPPVPTPSTVPPFPADPNQEFPWPRGRDRARQPAGSGQGSPQTSQSPTGAGQRSTSTSVDPAAKIKRSTGRGGAGNFSRSPPPPVNEPMAQRLEPAASVRSSGRGGIGNIVRPTQNDTTR
ncbi:hypothetical protein MIND_00980800 [Mycena indigotica]|uniref:Uncharacterized protein n=1 Tax=Mycena indigotica TaxID=2126181 RepID=A0A8H6SDD3_9AGAR|nr:uncharacterized protein MIND_00980800 [Mycena indigotica]KAF7297471.1 hypothetical protein MIND_00980800 [Mycena indigotica]